MNDADFDIDNMFPTPSLSTTGEVWQTTEQRIAALEADGRIETLIGADEVITPEMRERADSTVDAMRAKWAEKDAQTDKANRAFDHAFRKALREGDDAAVADEDNRRAARSKRKSRSKVR